VLAKSFPYKVAHFLAATVERLGIIQFTQVLSKPYHEPKMAPERSKNHFNCGLEAQYSTKIKIMQKIKKPKNFFRLTEVSIVQILRPKMVKIWQCTKLRGVSQCAQGGRIKGCKDVKPNSNPEMQIFSGAAVRPLEGK
jgi:hypothetical protein